MNGRRPAPRIGPAGREELGPLNALLVRIAGRVAGTTAPPNLFTTMGRTASYAPMSQRPVFGCGRGRPRWSRGNGHSAFGIAFFAGLVLLIGIVANGTRPASDRIIVVQ